MTEKQRPLRFNVAGGFGFCGGLFPALAIKRRVEGIKVLGVQIVLGDAEGVTDLSFQING